MKAYKIEIVVIDFEGMGQDGVSYEIENGSRYINPNILNIKEADIGEWNDDHPLNKNSTFQDEVKRLFDF